MAPTTSGVPPVPVPLPQNQVGCDPAPFTRSADANMYSEAARKKTFVNWKVSFLSPEAMVKAGFYYTKRSDLVRCPFCGVEIGRWEEVDDPFADHRKWSPSCRFVIDPPSSGNVPESSSSVPPVSETSVTTSQDSGRDVCGAMERNSHVLTNVTFNHGTDDVKVMKTRSPVFPEYTLLEKRLVSFSAWPMSLKVRPAHLADAGFFYTGKGDQTICFYCGGGLKDWEEDDDPWVEHAKWFSKCSYVLMSKGDAFITQISIKEAENEKLKKESSSSESTSSEIPNKLNKDCASSSKTATAPAGSNEEPKEEPKPSEQLLCKICYTKEMCVVFLPCTHLMACVNCALSMTHCGVCRKPITSHLRTFLS